jgi:hypothetical protein
VFAVCVRFPHNLAAQEVILTPVRPGVYEWRVGRLPIRIVVVHQLPQQEHNALLHLFSAREEQLRYGKDHYRPHSPDTSTLLYELFQTYQEDAEMTSKLKDFVRQSIDELLQKLPPEELRKRLTPQQRLEGLSPEQRLEGLSAEEVARALPPEVREALARKLAPNGSSSTPPE